MSTIAVNHDNSSEVGQEVPKKPRTTISSELIPKKLHYNLTTKSHFFSAFNPYTRRLGFFQYSPREKTFEQIEEPEHMQDVTPSLIGVNSAFLIVVSQYTNHPETLIRSNMGVLHVLDFVPNTGFVDRAPVTVKVLDGEHIHRLVVSRVQADEEKYEAESDEEYDDESETESDSGSDIEFATMEDFLQRATKRQYMKALKTGKITGLEFLAMCHPDDEDLAAAARQARMIDDNFKEVSEKKKMGIIGSLTFEEHWALIHTPKKTDSETLDSLLSAVTADLERNAIPIAVHLEDYEPTMTDFCEEIRKLTTVDVDNESCRTALEPTDDEESNDSSYVIEDGEGEDEDEVKKLEAGSDENNDNEDVKETAAAAFACTIC